jgi:lysostaphin
MTLKRDRYSEKNSLAAMLAKGDKGTRGQGDKGNFNQKISYPLDLLTTTLALGILALPVALATPVRALQVQVTPAKPQLGDTLSLVVQYDNPAITSSPSVTLNQKTYATFLIAPNTFRAFVPTTPLEKAGTRQIQVKGGGEVKNLSVSVRDRNFPVQRINLPPGKAGLDATKYELDRVAAFKQLVTPKKFWNGPFLKPNKGPITTIYGVRRYYNGKFANDYYHRGVDYAGAVGSPVMAPAAGRVALVGRVSQGFRIHGNIVGIDHGQGVTSTYLHLSRINVKEGDIVQAGQVIGAVGSTGATTGPHLHWGLYVQGQSVDPVPWRNIYFK